MKDSRFAGRSGAGGICITDEAFTEKENRTWYGRFQPLLRGRAFRWLQHRGMLPGWEDAL